MKTLLVPSSAATCAQNGDEKIEQQGGKKLEAAIEVMYETETAPRDWLNTSPSKRPLTCTLWGGRQAS